MPGVKGRSGRKRDPEIKSVRAVIDEHIPPEQWDKIWDALSRAAADGSIAALRLLLAYRFGLAHPEPPSAPPTAANNHIAYLLPTRDDEVLSPDAIVVKNEKELLDSTPGSAD